MTEGPDPERLLAEALRAQAVSTPLPPAKPLSVDGPTDGTGPAYDGSGSGSADESPTGGVAAKEPRSFGSSDDGRLMDLLSGAGHGLLSGRDPDTDDVSYPPRGADGNVTGPVGTTKLDAQRSQLAWWWIVLLAVALGLACGAIAGVLSLV